MSDQRPTPPTGAESNPGHEPAGATEAPGQAAPQGATETSPQAARTTRGDPLRGSRTSGIWISVLVLVIVLILLAIFILQNTQEIEVTYLGWSGTAPLSATLLIAAAGGALLVASAGMLRILQLRRRVKKERRQR